MFIKADFFLKEAPGIQAWAEVIYDIKESIVLLASVQKIKVKGTPFLSKDFEICRREPQRGYYCDPCTFFDKIGDMAKKVPMDDIYFVDTEKDDA